MLAATESQHTGPFSGPLGVMLLDVRHRDEDGREHGEHHCLDVAHQHLEQHHEDAQQDADGRHGRAQHVAHDSAECEHDEDDARQRDGDDVTCQHVGEESDHQRYGLGEDAEELDEGHQRQGHLEPPGHVAPEYLFPVGTCSRDVDDEERTECEEHRAGDVAGQVAASRWEGHDTQQVAQEDEEKAGEQVGRILGRLGSERRFDHVVVDGHDKHVHQSGKAFRCGVVDLVLLTPPCSREDAQHQNERVDHEHRHRLGDGDVEWYGLQFAADHLDNLPFLVLSALDVEPVGALAQFVGVGLVCKLRRAVDVHAALLRVEYHGQGDNQRVAAKVGDVPLVAVLDVTEQYLLQVHPALFLLSLL